jgi:hypothetical protein
VILGSIAVAGLFTLPLLWAASPATVAVACALDAAAGMVTVCAWFSARATRVPSALLGRVVALTRMAAFAAIPAAAVAGGVVLDATHDFAALVLIAAGVQIAVAAAAARSPLGRVA